MAAKALYRNITVALRAGKKKVNVPEEDLFSFLRLEYCECSLFLLQRVMSSTKEALIEQTDSANSLV